jgi:spore germination protein YaaH
MIRPRALIPWRALLAVTFAVASLGGGITPGGRAADLTGDEAVPAAFASGRPQVIGFLPYWSLSSAHLDWNALTTVAFFGVGVTQAGHLQQRHNNGTLTSGWAGWTSRRMTSIIRTAHAHRVRVVLTVQAFAWTANQARIQAAVLGRASTRARLANEIVAAVRARGADGVNLDFEPVTKGQRANYVRFVRTLRAALNRYRRNAELTVDTTASVANYDVAGLTARGAADAVVVMGYDYRTAQSNPGPIAPLTSQGYDLRETIRSFRARTAASKIILALPWYGRAWSTSSPDVGAGRVSAARYGGSATASYELAMSLAAQHGRHYLKAEATAWTTYQRRVCAAHFGCTTTWRKLFFDDARSLGTKLAVIKSSHLRGTAIWALGYEGSRTELWRVYRKAFPKR